MCVESLSALLHRVSEAGTLRGLQVCKRSPHITHLFFADDSLLFCNATIADCEEIQRLLLVYEIATGQQVNRQKTSLFFSPNTAVEIQEDIKQRFGADIIHQHEKYLGLPSLVGRNKRNTFQQLKEQVANKLAGWKEKFLSMAGREVLIKAVVQAILTHTMSCFLLPKSLCDDLNSMVSKFWWGQKNDERKLAWMRWEKLCTLKACGGMGFRDLRSFNLALLAKQGWRLQQQSNSLFYRVFKSKYFPDTSFVQAQQGRNPSYVWQSILAAQPIFKHGMRWQVGNGENICIWKDKWIPNPSTYQIISPRTLLPEDATVNVLIDADHGTWRSDLVRELFLNFEADIILSIPLSTRMPRDKLVWAATPNGKFMAKSAYWLVLDMKRAENESTSGPSGQQQL